MWNSLQEGFTKKSVVNQLLVRKQLTMLHMKDGDTMMVHLLVFEGLIRKLKLKETDLLEICSS